MRIILSVLVVSISLMVTPVTGQDFETGLAAYLRGDYETAFSKLRPVAQRGAAIAQTLLAFMYFNGTGVAQDYGEAVKWYRLAAEQGDVIAQSSLGTLYAYGAPTIQQDFAEAARDPVYPCRQ